MIKYKGNCQFRSRAKTSKKENNGLERKDGIVKKNHYTDFTLDEDVLKMKAGLATRDQQCCQLCRKVERPNQLPCWLESGNSYYINESQTRLHKSSSCSII